MKYSSLIAHFAAAIIITVILLVVYASVQQSHRSTANEPQVQIARDLSDALGKGTSINHLVSGNAINIEQSLAVFTEIFDKNGKPLQSTGFLNGSLPQPPPGVFEYTSANMEDVLTWQPQGNVRMAMVFEKVSSPEVGFVAAGRSLKEVEIRESNLVKMIGIAWIACLSILLVHFLLQAYTSKKLQNDSQDIAKAIK